MSRAFTIKTMRLAPYQQTYDAMRSFTATRVENTPDEIWLCEHPPVFTLGLAGQSKHILSPHDIPIIKTDRGGQVTYHGPGQLVAYVLMDMRRCNYHVKEYVNRIEQAVLLTLKDFGLKGLLVDGAHGVYVQVGRVFNTEPVATATNAQNPFKGLAKISALGIKVSRHCTYHGVALNVKMDLKPFSWINPCGYESLQTTDLFTMGVSPDEDSWTKAATLLAGHLKQVL